ncbi:nitrogen fixation protein NifZ [Frankia sp. AgKG'84/4]|uniref:nitrogen fixation protein NifZ n=1 Tax=Frankia sp. AgKG'84/4 TaxID=573490 RepID=UPI00200DB671|nr:nitrogen fixation protein NifZ [Frankia sp. AgKG'84/4]MCL9794760.1 nitrogen fixation protein NifZ [Frankia sp. AgKG'84/4]
MSSNTYDVGDVVVTVKELRNDGTYPDPAVSVGDVLVEAGTRGEVINVGLYLQEHIVYAVAFRNGRVVGALERELAPPPDDEGEPARQPSTPPAAVPIATSVSTSAPTADEHHGGSGGGCKHGKADCSGGGGKGHGQGHGDGEKAGGEQAAKSTVAGAAGGKDGPR